MTDIIRAENLSKHYGRRVGIDRLDLVLSEGTVCGFLGPNGVGKTTAIRLLLGFLRPTRGRAEVFGLDCWRHGPRIRADIGYIPGDLRLYPWLTARTALKLFGRIRRRDFMPAGLDLAEEFGLGLDVAVRDMSRGMRQKLGLILALAPGPRLLVLDEPTMSLDPVMQERLRLHLLKLARTGHTVFFSSHTLSEVERLCERVVILRAGCVVADAPVNDLRASAQREVVITWRDGAGETADPPPNLKLLRRAATEWRGTLDGPSSELIAWLATRPVQDVILGQPNMETLFQQFYQPEQ